LSELISEGNAGLLKSIDKFDLKFNVRFLTYAAWWIDVEMQTLLNSRLVHVPHQTLKDQRKQRIQEDREIARGTRTNYSFTEVTTVSIDKVNVAHGEDEISTETADVMIFLNKAGLSRRQRLILTLYYGLRNGAARTLEEISQLLYELEGRYLTRERIRQLKENAAVQLHSYLQTQGLEGSWDV
jgi:RNA polymerase sigma factor (sigma-70 family)